VTARLPTAARLAFAVVSLLALVSASIVGHGIGGPLYLLVYAVAVLPGLPIGFRLFGARHPGGWIAGILCGYALTAIALWAPIAIGRPSRLAFIAAWLIVGVLTWTLSRWPFDRAQSRRNPAIALPSWDARDFVGLALILTLTLGLAGPPLARIGETDAHGDRVYRAYFTADFVWHAALSSELSKFSMPPRNPYLASQPIHYYWAYFLLPATVSQLAPGPLHDVQRCLKVNALITALLFMSSIFLAAWVAVGRTWPVTIAVALALVAASAEGTYEIYRLWSLGQSLRELHNINIDAITAWHFQGVRIDGLPRCLWYVPQHSTAYALGAMGLTGAAAIGSTGPAAAILLCGVMLAGSAMMNPFVGGIFAAAWGLAVAIDAIRRPAPLSRLLLHGLAAIPVAAAVLWCSVAHMVDGAGGVLDFGFHDAPAHAPILALLLSLGPVLIPAVAGLVVRSPVAFSRVLPALMLVSLSLALMYLVRLRVDTAWVPFRAGQMLLVAAPALVARALVYLWSGGATRWIAVTAFVAAFVIGLPTTVIDAYNAQDVDDREIGPGFRWTLALTPDEQQALAWIRTVTPAHALVQMEPTARDRDLSPGNWGERWSVVPTFGERRMAAGIPISLMRVPEYGEKSRAVKVIYETPNAHEAWTIARRLHIAYLYVDANDRQTYPDVAKFDTSQYFAPVFKRGEVAVYEVR
jgi:hypothetical protein